MVCVPRERLEKTEIVGLRRKGLVHGGRVKDRETEKGRV